MSSPGKRMCAVEVCVLESFVAWVTCIHRVPNTFSDTLMVSFGQLVLKERTYAPCHATQFCTSPLSTTALLFFTVTRMIASNSMTWWQSTRTSLEEEAMDKICTYRETMCPRLWPRAAAPACFVPRLLNPAMIAEGCSSVLHLTGRYTASLELDKKERSPHGEEKAPPLLVDGKPDIRALLSPVTQTWCNLACTQSTCGGNGGTESWPSVIASLWVLREKREELPPLAISMFVRCSTFCVQAFLDTFTLFGQALGGAAIPSRIRWWWLRHRLHSWNWTLVELLVIAAAPIHHMVIEGKCAFHSGSSCIPHPYHSRHKQRTFLLLHLHRRRWNEGLPCQVCTHFCCLLITRSRSISQFVQILDDQISNMLKLSVSNL